MPGCDHCLLEFPPSQAVRATIDGQLKTFCCEGCHGVYLFIHGQGLDGFYRKRSGWTPGPMSRTRVDPARFAHLVNVHDGWSEAAFLVRGIRCASCVWLNERLLERLPGVREARLNYATHRLKVSWDPTVTSLGPILERISSAGYQPRPDSAEAAGGLLEAEMRDQLIRLGTALFLSSQLMMYTAALYAGYFQGIEPGIKMLFDWVALLLATPVVFYSGLPLFSAAWRGLRNGVFNMDSLIVLGSGSAYFYSIYQVLTDGQVYFDTSAMIVSLVLLGRYIETGARRRASESVTRLMELAPSTCRRIREPDAAGKAEEPPARPGTSEEIPVEEIRPGNLIEILPGDRIPTDGRVLYGNSETDESMLTGESMPVAKGPGSGAYAGTLNLNGRLILTVTATAGETALSRITKAVTDAQARRAPMQGLADRIVGWFVPTVLALGLGTLAVWLYRGEPIGRALMHVVAVLVIACPCALGLATPLAILVGTTRAAGMGLVLKGGDIVEAVDRIDTVVFDKTGTLTEGRPALVFHRGIGIPDAEALRLAASLERFSEHPVGRALAAAYTEGNFLAVDQFLATPGLGVRGSIGGDTVVAGSASFLESEGIDMTVNLSGQAADQSGTVVYLARDGRLCGLFVLSDRPRSEAAEAVSGLKRLGISIALVTGDSLAAAEPVARSVGIEPSGVFSGVRPEGKAAMVHALKKKGCRVIMVGDGINDAPALTEADVGAAVGRATDIALESADVVALREDLRLIEYLVTTCRSTCRVVRQNLFWAFLYNVLAIPLAMTGFLHPIVAAGAMALSSVTVVGNSLRAGR